MNVRFATRPTVRSVVSQVLDEAIKQLLPTLQLDLAHTSLSRAAADTSAQQRPTPLLEVALHHLIDRDELDFNDATFDPPLSDPQKQAVELAIRSLRELLKPAFQQALTRYWSEPGTGETGSRWLGLSNTLSNTLRTAALTQPGLTDAHQDTLDQIVTWPDSTQRQRAKGKDAASVFVLDSTLTHSGSTSTMLSPDLLITRQIDGQTRVLHATAAGVITPYASLEDFGKAWGKRLEQAYVFEALSWKRQEPQGNVFDTQAALLLNWQLENLTSIAVPGKGTLNELEQAFARASNPAPWFTDAYTPPVGTLEQMREKLPTWMGRATPAERLAYSTRTLELASSVQRNQGRTFLTDIPDIRGFTRQQLQPLLQPLGLQADQVQVTFKVPVGDLGSGYIERVPMSLTDMALRNLAGLPKGEMEVRHHGQLLRDAALPQQLKQIITQVDIGTTYPALLQRQLLDDTPTARERSTLFAEQVPIQLSMQALELKLKGAAGISARGYQHLEAVLKPGVGEKTVDGHPIVMRPLAFLRKPGATPDVVTNMFVIEPQNAANGPHLLYRPMLAPALQEFATRQALLEAVQQPGPLQQSILAWLPDDRTRAVYGNGGFNIPNIAHYYRSNEFDAPDTPAPTALATDGYAPAKTLARDLHDGRLMEHLFNANARSLVDLAQGQSVSDTQSRWASYKELGWLLFNTVLPVLRGPGAMAGWLVQLANTEEDIKKLTNLDNQDASAATVDLLVNVALLLAHADTSGSTTPMEKFEETARPAGPALRQPNAEPAPPRAMARQSPAPDAPGVIGNHSTALDFSFSSPRALTPGEHAQIDSFKVPAPSGVGAAIAEGPQRGLYRVHERLYAQVDGHWFRAASDLDGVFIIDANHKARTGPPLIHDAQGHWSFDTRPKLRGGAGNAKSIAARLKKNAQVEREMQAQHSARADANLPVFVARDAIKHQTLEINTDYHSARKKLHELWTENNLDEQRGQLTEQIKTQLEATNKLKADLEKSLIKLEEETNTACAALQEQVETLNPRKLGGWDDTSENKRQRSIDYQGMFTIYRDIESLRIGLVNDSNTFGVGGAPIGQVLRDAGTGNRLAYDELQETLKRGYHDREKLCEAAQATQTALEKWKNDSAYGNKKAEEHLKTQKAWPPAFTVLKMRLGVLSHLKELALNRMNRSTEPSEMFFLQRFKDNDLKSVSSAFLEQQQYSGYTLAERKATLQTVIDKYQRSLSDMTSLHEENPAFFRDEYRQALADRLNDVINDARTQLAEVMGEEQSLSPAVAKHAEKQRKPANQRVFNTRDKETLIGSLRRPQAGESHPIIDVLDAQTGRPIASYSEHPTEGEWVKIVPAQPVPRAPATPSPKPLASYRSDGQRLMDEGASIERSILFQKKKLEDPLRRESLNPLDWNDMLEAQAERLERMAQRTAAEHGTDPEATELVKQWNSAVGEMRKNARQHCADGYMALPPKPANVDFLWQHGFVDINLLRRDIATKSGDVFTEYAVRKKDQGEVLWYAHFHYPAKGSPRNLYTAAHLKIPSQRTKTQKDLIAEAGNNRVVEQITRARIGSPLDEKLFLKL
ncbi:hypothetical protein RGV33_20305 [Pseudomonas sp. Bout1]|uniref:dermonecrotic toxin domain-containing protein n=1 Tax=Pseudomonas sp. Bout1 TaxID=3048600 RepID=UPI002AB360DE|nr:DUF6543 domain-containing protein [Pseudomonas sp. Bout1]MDY7533990.1 hypothetical protein [Pseudomonas sp. Bout1]MEB0188478.1 hypothetical protein [Pseudomonas sp. Bout1]